MGHSTRSEVLGQLAAAVGSVRLAHPTRVAIDGPPASGKTTLADEVALILRARGKDVIRAGVDDFLFPHARRYRRGPYSAEDCYFDSHNTEMLNRVLLDPLGPDGDRRFRTAIHDRTTDTALSLPPTTAPDDAVLLFDGVFLMRPELNGRWDLRILVSTAFEKTIDRALVREQQAPAEVERRWRERYIPAQQFYFATVHPADHADMIVHNDDPQHPVLETRTR